MSANLTPVCLIFDLRSVDPGSILERSSNDLEFLIFPMPERMGAWGVRSVDGASAIVAR